MEGKNGFVCVVELIVDVAIRSSNVLEPQAAGSNLFQSPGGAIHPADHFPEDGVDIARVKQSSDHRENQNGVRKEGTATAGTGRHVLYDVERRIPRRLSRALGFPT